MKKASGEPGDEPAIVSVTGKNIPHVEVIKTLSGTIFGPLLLGKFSYEGELEVNYTYIKRLNRDNALDQHDFWQLVSSTKQHPGKGFLPHIIAYSTQSNMARGYHDVQTSFETWQEELGAGDEVVLNLEKNKIRELYFEPFPENMKMILHKRAKDRRYFTEAELAQLIVSVLSTLKNLEEHGTHHGILSLDCIIPLSNSYYLYHPILIPNTVNLFTKIHSLSKHYGAPEVVELILECNSDEEFYKIKDETDWTKADIFSLALIVLELCTLVEEDDWYNDEMLLKKDILEVKMNMVRDQYSNKLARLLEAMLSPVQVRPSVKGLLSLALAHSQDHSHYERLLQKSKQDQPAEPIDQEQPEIKKTVKLPQIFDSVKEEDSAHENLESEVSDLDSKDIQKLEKRGSSVIKDIESASEKLPETHEIREKIKVNSPKTSPHKLEKKHEPIAISRLPEEPVKKIANLLYPSMVNPEENLKPSNVSPKIPEQIHPRIETNQANIEMQMRDNQFNKNTLSLPLNSPRQVIYSHQRSPMPESSSISRVILPPTQTSPWNAGPVQHTLPTVHSSIVVGGGGNALSPRVIYGQHSPSRSPGRHISPHISDKPTRIETKITEHSTISHVETRPTGKSTVVREDRSKSPKVVSIKKFIIKNGQKILISEENYPGVDDGFRGYIDLREPNHPHTIPDPTPSIGVRTYEPRPEGSRNTPTKPEIVRYQAMPQKSIEPVFGNDSVHKSSVQGGSRLHSLAALTGQDKPASDFGKIANEIKSKLDELISKEKDREEREAKLIEEIQGSKKKSKKNSESISGMNIDSSSDGTLRIKQLDLSDVQCCRECEKLKQDKKGHLYQCLNHPKSPLFTERPISKTGNKKKSLTPEGKKVSVERKLFPTIENLDQTLCPRYYKSFSKANQLGSSKSSKKLIALPVDEKAYANDLNNLRCRGDDKVVELVNLTKVNKIKESLAEAKQRRIKRAMDEMPATGVQKTKSRSRSKHKNKKGKVEENTKLTGTDLWMKRLKANEPRK